ncbi:hypothetical protein PPYR_01385 [Photinus pyralis]|uniref:Peptidase aspartic putative domain-containing protein n=1 Tax=Photinus pyralis TaxID=7054 RepID=A0A5N4B494_PHOPY|nr:hypothetical protein PPYR_01385 [Photinus pyralis]
MKKEWENSLPTNSLPTLQEFIEFLTKRCFTLETLYNHSQTNIHNTKSIPNKQLPQFSKPFKDREHSFAITNTILCPYCKNNHYIYNCYAFLNLPTEEKFSQIRKMKLCSNCLRSGHLKNSCHSSKCRKCNKSHNTLLHDDNFNAHKFNTSHNARNDTAANIHQAQSSVMQVINSETSQQQPSESQNITRTYHSFTGICQTEVLLSTAEVFIDDRFGRPHKCRALLDSGSQSHLITQKLCNKLQLNLEEFSLHLKGINQASTNITQKATTNIKSKFYSFQARFWEVEELPQKQILTSEAQYCETYFKETTTRNAEGRFIVRLPFSDKIDELVKTSNNISLNDRLLMGPISPIYSILSLG